MPHFHWAMFSFGSSWRPYKICSLVAPLSTSSRVQICPNPTLQESVTLCNSNLQLVNIDYSVSYPATGGSKESPISPNKSSTFDYPFASPCSLPLAFHQFLNNALDFLGAAFKAGQDRKALCRWHKGETGPIRWPSKLHRLT